MNGVNISCCYQCPNRTHPPEANCHATCDKYLSERKLRDKYLEDERKRKEKYQITHRHRHD